MMDSRHYVDRTQWNAVGDNRHIKFDTAYPFTV